MRYYSKTYKKFFIEKDGIYYDENKKEYLPVEFPTGDLTGVC